MKKYVLVSMVATVVLPIAYSLWAIVIYEGHIDGRPDNAPMRAAVGFITLVLPIFILLQLGLLYLIGILQSKTTRPSIYYAFAYPSIFTACLLSLLFVGGDISNDYPSIYAWSFFGFVWMNVFFGSFVQYILMLRNVTH